jgi:hypothetical protein
MKSKEFKSKVESLKDRGDKFEFTYKGDTFTLDCWHPGSEISWEKSYSVAKNSFNSMNVEKITDKYITLYSYDMMSQRSTYKMAIDLIELV